MSAGALSELERRWLVWVRLSVLWKVAGLVAFLFLLHILGVY